MTFSKHGGTAAIHFLFVKNSIGGGRLDCITHLFNYFVIANCLLVCHYSNFSNQTSCAILLLNFKENVPISNRIACRVLKLSSSKVGHTYEMV